MFGYIRRVAFFERGQQTVFPDRYKRQDAYGTTYISVILEWKKKNSIIQTRELLQSCMGFSLSVTIYMMLFKYLLWNYCT